MAKANTKPGEDTVKRAGPLQFQKEKNDSLNGNKRGTRGSSVETIEQVWSYFMFYVFFYSHPVVHMHKIFVLICPHSCLIVVNYAYLLFSADKCFWSSNLFGLILKLISPLKILQPSNDALIIPFVGSKI
jgi:hypothetical protein